MSAVKQIEALARDRVGKGASRAVRREGRVPAVVYGAGQPVEAISLDANQTRQLIFAGHFLTTIFEIDLGGRRTRAIPRDYQLDPVKDTPIHVDFLRLAEGQTLKVEVPVHVVGQDASPGLRRGGTLNIVRHTIEVEAPADAIPDSIDADISGLDIGGSLHASSLTFPAGVRPTITERDFTIVTVVAPSGFAEEEPATAPATSTAEAAKA